MADIGRVLIVGGGVAGLTTAAALHRHGFTPELVERQPTWHALGAGFLVHANGLRMLRLLDLAAGVESAGAVVRRWEVCDEHGDVLSDTDLEALWGDVGPCVGIERANLQRALMPGVANLRCRLGTSVTSLVQDADRVTVGFSDGSTADYGLVVGADGIDSTIRALTLTTAAKRPRCHELAKHCAAPPHRPHYAADASWGRLHLRACSDGRKAHVRFRVCHSTALPRSAGGTP